mgnify:CR=1 FL=1
MKIAIFPGSFNPFTKGHQDIVCRALTIFDKIVIGIGYNPDKPQPEDLQERLQQIKALYNNDARVEVEAYNDLTIDFAKYNPNPVPFVPFVVRISLNNPSAIFFGIPPALSNTLITAFEFSS